MSASRDLRRLSVVIVLVAWSLAAVVFALWLFVIAGRPGSRFAGGALVDDPAFVAELALWLLLLGLIVVAVAWAVAFVGRGFSRPSTLGVVGLFLVALLAVLICTRPLSDEWWAHGGVRQIGDNAFVAVSWAQDSRAAGAILLVAAIAACGLLAIAVRRGPQEIAATVVPPGWYTDPHGTASWRWWDGTTWTEVTG